MLGMRIGDGEWSEAGGWTGLDGLAQWSATLTAEGPVFAQATTTYVFAGGATAVFTATVVEGDTAVRWEMDVDGGDFPDAVAQFRLPAVPGVTEALFPKGYGQWARDRRKKVGDQTEAFAALSPNSSLINIFTDNPHRIVLEGAHATLELVSRDPGAWVDRGPAQTYRGVDHWHLDMISEMWNGWQRKAIPVHYSADGTTTLNASMVQGRRKWSVSAGTPRVGDQLRKVRGMVLSWPGKAKHPCLFVDMPQIRDVWQRASEEADLARVLRGSRYAGAALNVLKTPVDARKARDVGKVVDQLRDMLSKLGNYDVMRQAIGVVSLYDAVIDSDLIGDEDRAVFRAQMAYLSYLMADPMCWSTERGYGSGNPNMHCSYTLSLGVIACALRDHPMAQQWAAHATAWMNEWLNDEVGENGEWLPEGSHYGIVSLEPMLSYAIAAKRAGYHDFTTDPRLKKLILYFAKMHTPPDLQRDGHRVTGAYGRGTSGDRLAICGLAACMTADTDPAYSAVMQWMWAQTGYPGHVGDNRLGGYEPYYLDRHLPQATPQWESELFPQVGALLRADFATSRESYLNLLACVDSKRNLDVWVAGIGGVSQWFALGKPLSTCFTFDTGYKVRHELLRDGVYLARNYAPGDPMTPFGHYSTTHFGAFAARPAVDYVRTRIANTHPDDRDWSPPNVPDYPRLKAAETGQLDWTRQLLFVKDATRPASAYIVLRDTTTGGEPTAWQFWTLSEKIDSPEQIGDRVAFLADKPGNAIAPARELPRGDRYTALGQFGVDVEYFVAEPADTPRHTLRYGGEYRRVPEFQDALHLQRPGDGSYYVAILPRPADADAPTFSRVGDGKIIKTSGEFGADYAFLAAGQTTAEGEAVSFDGTAGVVQQRQGRLTLSLAAAGTVRADAFGLQSPVPATVVVSGDSMVLRIPAQSPGGELVITAPGRWHTDPPRGVEVKTDVNALRLSIPEGSRRIEFRQR